MLYNDNVYGEVKIIEPIILDLINSKALQRLKGISQAGYFEPHFPNTHHTRFDHSMGDYILLNKFNAPIEEQIAGLIHDVSHSVFSHCIDYALDNNTQAKQSHQDDYFEEYVMKTDVPGIIENHGYDLKYVLDEHNFPLQENDLPDLCADRIDYSLRTAFHYTHHDSELEKLSLKNIVSDLSVVDNKWVFKTFETAKTYAEMFKLLNEKFYSGKESAAMFRSVGDYLEKNEIKGINVSSAGTHYREDKGNAIIKEELKNFGIDATKHKRRNITKEILEDADLIVAMAGYHQVFLKEGFGFESVLFNEVCYGVKKSIDDNWEAIDDYKNNKDADREYIKGIVDFIHDSTPKFAKNMNNFSNKN